MNTVSFSRSTRLLASLLALFSCGACANRTATFNVTRPAMLNVAEVGNTMTVGPIAAPNPAYLPAAAELSAQLQERIAHSLNPSIRLVAQGGGVVITGAVLSNDYSERIERFNRSCFRSVQTGTVNGVPQFRTEPYPCADLRRVGEGLSRVQFTLTHGQSGQVIFDQIYEFTQRVVTTGLESPYNDRRAPGFINSDALLAQARGVNLEQFAHVILPWQEAVTVEFEDCNGDARCRQGVEMVQRGNLAGGEAMFTQVIDQFGPNVPPNEAERVGEALFNRGLARKYLGRYTQSVTDLTRAMQLRPDESDWAVQLNDARTMSRDQEALRSQGAIANQTQDVQRAGTP